MAESAYAAGARRRRPAPGPDGHTACDVCGSYRYLQPLRGRTLCGTHVQRWLFWYGLPLLAAVAAGAAALAAVRDRSALAALAWTPPALYALLILREATRNAVVAAAGMRLGRTMLGVGPRLFAVGLVDVRPVPTMAGTDVAPCRDPGSRGVRRAWRGAAAARLGVTAAALAGGLAWGAEPGLAVAAGAAYVLLTDLVASGGRARGAFDVWALFDGRRVPVLFDSPAGWGVTVRDYVEALDALLGDGAAPERRVEAVRLLRELQPDDVGLLPRAVVAYVALRQYDEAYAAAVAWRDATDGEARALARSAIARVLALAGVRPEEMRAESAAALAALPDSAPVLSTAALVAAVDGDLAAAEAYCDRATDDDDWLRARVLAVRALVAARRGDEAAAASYAGQARALDPATPALDLL